MSQIGTQVQTPEPVEIKFFYSSCTGRTRRTRFNVAYNTETGGTEYLDKLAKEAFKGPEHKGVGCSRVIQIMAKPEEIARLEGEGWVFKEVELIGSTFNSATWWSLTRKVEVVEKGRDESGWYDLVEIDGVKYKAYRDRIVRVD